MEIKKTPKADLQNKRAMFLEIGLILSLALVIAAFSWSQKEKTVEILETTEVLVEEEIIEITRQEEMKPPTPIKQTITVVSDIINVVKDEVEIKEEIDFAEFNEDDILVEDATVSEGEYVEDVPFMIVEEMPSFQGGDVSKFRAWVMQQLVYPSIAQENGIQGAVTVSFVIEKDGALTNITVLRSPDQALSDETIRVLKKSPRWTAGKQRGSAVRVKFNIPIIFRIN